MTVEEAIAYGDIAQLRALLEAEDEVDLDYLLTEAACWGKLEIVQWLLGRGAAVDATDYHGCSALTCAAHRDHLAVVEELLRGGANPSHCDEDTETVLMWAADHPGNAAVLRALIRAGADVSAFNDLHYTALTWSVKHGDLEMVQIFLEAGAELQPYDLTLAIGKREGAADTVRLLLKYGAEAFTLEDLEERISCKNREAANLLRQAAHDRRLQMTGEAYPQPEYAIGTSVRTLRGTPREGWIVLVEWHHKHRRYGYYIEITATTQARKNVPTRYWDEELKTIENV